MPNQLEGSAHGPAHTVIPTAVLNSILTNQQNLADLVADFRTQNREKEKETPVQRHGEASVAQSGDALVTQAELRHLLQAEHNGPGDVFDLEPPLVDEVQAAPYPMGYQPPSFRKFDGTGSSREHLMCFLDDLGVHRDNKGLRLKEFSKSLAGRALTWYVKLRPRSIRTWEELAAEFCGKQKRGESLIAFVKRYRDRALQCKETLPEADLVGITTFAEPMRRGADVAEAIKRQGKRAKETENVFDVCASYEREKKKNFIMSMSSRKFAFNDVNELPQLPISRAQTCELIEDWLKDGTIQTKVNRPPLSKEQRTFQKQLKAGKVLLPEMEGVEGELHRRPLPNHDVNTIVSPSQGRIRIEEVDDEANAGEETLVNGLTKTRGWRILFGQLGLSWDAQQEAAKALVKIAQNQGGELSRVNAPLTRVRRALVDNGSGVNILPSYLFKMLNMPKYRLWVSDVTLNTFHGEPVESRGCVNAVLEVGPIKTVNTFQVVDGDPGYHLLLGRPWIHLHQCIPSTLHQCIKSNFRGREIEIPSVTAPFEAREAHLIDASLFNELAPPGKQKTPVEQLLRDAPPELQDTPKQREDNLEEIDVSDEEGKMRPLYVNRALSEDEKRSLGGVSVEESKVEAIQRMKPPTNIKEAQQLVGKPGYIRHFVPAMGELVGPLRSLLKGKGVFCWEERHQSVFDKIKQVMSSMHVMSPPTPHKPLRLYLAVTEQAINGLIAQEIGEQERPICYLSRVLKDVEA
ncbi:Aspartic peptidase domain superfamily [Sesbania bispinosa]|nr:Aspartic peptidase domain superfamily [Sesbania bispinosa]